MHGVIVSVPIVHSHRVYGEAKTTRPSPHHDRRLRRLDQAVNGEDYLYIVWKTNDKSQSNNIISSKVTVYLFVMLSRVNRCADFNEICHRYTWNS